MTLRFIFLSTLLMAVIGCGKDEIKSGVPRVEGELPESAKNLMVVGSGGGNSSNQSTPASDPNDPNKQANPVETGQTETTPTTPAKKIGLSSPKLILD